MREMEANAAIQDVQEEARLAALAATGILDTGSAVVKAVDHPLAKASTGGGLTVDERVTAHPAVAGGIVFFTTTTFKSAGCPCEDANLYALTILGGPAYDTTGDGVVTAADSPLVSTVAGQRATAPFIADQHLAFGTSGGSLEMYGDPRGFNAVAHPGGLRILAWREIQ